MRNNDYNIQILLSDYQHTLDQFKTLVDIRFKLLAFVPTLAGAAIAFLSDTLPAETALAVGVLGLIVTIGITFYDIRNTQFYDAAVHRAKWLEAMLDLPVVTEPVGDNNSKETTVVIGGLFNERPRQKLKFFGWIEIWHDRGLGLAYGAALGGWAFIVSKACLSLAGNPNYRIALVHAAIVGVLFALEYQHLSGMNKPHPNKELEMKVLDQRKKS